MRVVKCFICGKDFIVAPCNLYRAVIEGKVKHFCSYSCFREYEREKEAKKKPKEG